VLTFNPALPIEELPSETVDVAGFLAGLLLYKCVPCLKLNEVAGHMFDHPLQLLYKALFCLCCHILGQSE
jgi:hypothetical protein